MIAKLQYYWKYYNFQKKWRRMNMHNNTTIGNIFPIDKVTVKNKTYGKLNVKLFNEDDPGLEIGNYCSIAEGTHFLLGGEHPFHRPSTFPFKVIVMNGMYEAVSKGKIVIDDDVWIGYGCIILSGVHIHQGAVIAAGSVVYKDIPPYAIYSNGKVIKFRFDDNTIAELLKIDYGNLTDKKISENLDYFYSDINSKNDVELLKKITKES